MWIDFIEYYDDHSFKHEHLGIFTIGRYDMKKLFKYDVDDF